MACRSDSVIQKCPSIDGQGSPPLPWLMSLCEKSGPTASFGRGSLKRLIAPVVGNEPRPQGADSPDFSRRLVMAGDGVAIAMTGTAY